jgi:hypothetical protein
MFVISAALIYPQTAPGGFRPDFGVFWTAGQLAHSNAPQIYDVAAMTEAQRWLTNPANGPRPFVYPPSALILFAPFSMLPFIPAFLLWTLLSLTAFVMASRYFVDWRGAALCLAAPPVLMAVITGQVALLIAGATIAALAQIERRPLVAGLMLGMAAAVKPQALLLAPLALARAGHWRALAAAILTGSAMMTASLIWDPQLWRVWLVAIARFQTIVTQLGLESSALTPASAAAMMGLSGGARIAFIAAGAISGIGLTWWGFAGRDLTLRTVTLVCGSLLCSPYAMMYELAVLVPAAAALLLSHRSIRLAASLVLTGLGGLAAPLMLALAVLTDARPARTSRAVQGDD